MFVDEIKNSRILQIVYYFVFFSFVLTFSDWFNREYFTLQSVKNFTAVCWPHFKSCTDLYIFNAVPEGYSLGILYACLGIFLFLSLYFAIKEDWRKAVLLLLPLAAFKLFGLYFLSYLPTGNYTVLEVFVAILLIFSKNKTYALKLLVTVFYFSSFIIKIHSGYFTGNIFTSLNLGVPVLPSSFLNLYGIAFALLVVIFPILLWSKNAFLRKFSVFVLGIFHIYSIIWVGFRYPFLCLSLHFLLFLNTPYEKFSFKKIVTDYATVFSLMLLIILQSVPLLIKGDEKITNEGQKYGFYMFDANRQCVSNMTIFYRNGTLATSTYENHQGMFRCDPYQEWFETYLRCRNSEVQRIEWSFNSSINGSSYFTLVNTEDACKLDYKPFQHNDWIKEGIKNSSLKVYKNSI